MSAFDRSSDFLGRGWGFPPTFDQNLGEVAMVQDEEDIVQSLRILFSTNLRERVMLPEYGCTLEDHVFDPIGPMLFNEIEHLLADAILFFEPRIVVDHIEVEQDSVNLAQINITLAYTIRQSNTRSNMVYPFYLAEGSNVRQIVMP